MMTIKSLYQLIATLSLVALPLSASAQSTDKPVRLGLFGGQIGPEDEAFQSGLRDLGWVRGKNIEFEERWTRGKNELLPGYAAEMAQSGVRAIVVGSARYIDVLRQATKDIPIVFCSHGDPVGAGHAASLDRPGGNNTGMMFPQTEINAGMLELLTEALPAAKRVAIVFDPNTPSNTTVMPAIETAAQKLKVELQAVPATNADELDTAMAKAAQDQAQAVFVQASPNTYNNRGRVADATIRNRLPSVFPWRENVLAGGLMSYGIDINDIFRSCAGVVDKVLKGANPGEIPIEKPSKFKTAVNLNTARALGVELPQTVLARAETIK